MRLLFRAPGPAGVVAVSWFRARRPTHFTPCVTCTIPVPDNGPGLTVMCPACIESIKETVARESRPYRTSEGGGSEFGRGRRG